MLVEESVKIRRESLARRCVQPLGGGEEICDVVVERRNREPAELLRQPEAQGCGDRGKDHDEANNGGDAASLVRQSLAGSNQKIKPNCGSRLDTSNPPIRAPWGTTFPAERKKNIRSSESRFESSPVKSLTARVHQKSPWITQMNEIK